jgi:hypothetical protein
MQEQLLQPLSEILRTADRLLLESELNDTQRGFLQSAYDAAHRMMEMVVSFPNVAGDYAGEVFSYEARSHLASIIGYAELLLDEDDGDLNTTQREYIGQVQMIGKRMVRFLPGTAE